jgi:hypothetical protein
LQKKCDRHLLFLSEIACPLTECRKTQRCSFIENVPNFHLQNTRLESKSAEGGTFVAAKKNARIDTADMNIRVRQRYFRRATFSAACRNV